MEKLRTTTDEMSRMEGVAPGDGKKACVAGTGIRRLRPGVSSDGQLWRKHNGQDLI